MQRQVRFVDQRCSAALQGELAQCNHDNLDQKIRGASDSRSPPPTRTLRRSKLLSATREETSSVIYEETSSVTHEEADLMGAYSIGLWDYALSLYALPGEVGSAGNSQPVPDMMSTCLLLQDEAGLDVCELLWIHWLSAHGIALAASPTRLLEDVRDWQGWMTGMLRERRRQLKQELTTLPATRDPAAVQRLERLYQQLKACELSAEQETLAQLERLSPALSSAEGATGLRAPFAHVADPLQAFQQSLVLLSGTTTLTVGDHPSARALRRLALARVPAGA